MSFFTTGIASVAIGADIAWSGVSGFWKTDVQFMDVMSCPYLFVALTVRTFLGIQGKCLGSTGEEEN